MKRDYYLSNILQYAYCLLLFYTILRNNLGLLLIAVRFVVHSHLY